jgi:signal transduction histidine kinase
MNADNALENCQKPTITIQLFSENSYSGFRIMDNGPGVPKEIKEKIWEPAFTTHGTGSGLGLVICRDIVDQHGGDIFYTDNHPKGAVFTVILPNGVNDER